MMVSRISKDDYYLDIALAVCKRSTCIRRRYGCVIVNNDEIIATGYNGSPRGFINCCDTGECGRVHAIHGVGDYSDCHSVHAEQNAMISADRQRMIGATLYLTGEEFTNDLYSRTGRPWQEIKAAIPCSICHRMIINAGIVRVVNRCGDVCLQ